MKLFLPMLAVLFLAGCGSIESARKVVPLDSFRHVFVEQELNDNHHIDDVLVAELRQLGYDASSGPRTMMPENADAILTYTDRWEWDFKTYLIDLKLELRTARTDKKLADAHYYRPSLKSESPAQIAHELLGQLYGRK